MSDKELEELRKQTQRGNRLSSDDGDFVEAIMAMLDEVEEGDRSKVLSLYDPQLASLIYALEENGERYREVIESLSDARGTAIDIDDVGRTAFLKLAVRVGLQAAAPDLLEDAQEAVTRRTQF